MNELLLIAQVPLQLALVLLTQPRALLPHVGNEVLQLAVEVVLGLLFRESGLDIRDGDCQLVHDGVHLPSQQADDVDLEAVRDCAASLGHMGDAPSSCRTAHLAQSLTCLGERERHAREFVAEPYRLATLFGMYPFLKKLFADGGYQGPEFHTALTKLLPQLETEIVKRSDHAKGFVVLPRRWVVERTIAWLNNPPPKACQVLQNLVNRKALAFLRLASVICLISPKTL